MRLKEKLVPTKKTTAIVRADIEVTKQKRENEQEIERIKEGGGINLILAYSAEAP